MSFGQYSSTEIGNIVYNSYSGDNNKEIKNEYAILFDKYINEYYPQKSLPSIYLIIVDETAIEIAYDNMSSYSSKYKYFGVLEKFNKSGIRIKLSVNCNKGDALKLLDYGINNIKTLKKHRRKSIRKGFKNLSLSPGDIETILNKPITAEIKELIYK